MIKLAAASKAGTAHDSGNGICQDSVETGHVGVIYCAALSDGAGSVERSELASQAVAEVVVRMFCSDFEHWYDLESEELRRELIRNCRSAVKEKNSTVEADCTLLFFVLSEDGRYIWGHIGDGAIFGIDSDDSVELISEPENGDEPNQTYFLSGKNAQEHLFIDRGDSFKWRSVILCSDGVSPSLWNKMEDEFAGALHLMTEWLEDNPDDVVSAALGRELDETFRQRTTDDMSIAIMVRTEEKSQE